MTSPSVYYLISAVLGFCLAIPPNTYIVIINLESLRKEGKLSPPDLIFMAKAMVNLLLQGLLSLRGMLTVLCPDVFHRGDVYAFVNSSIYFMMYFSFWMTAWLSAHYCTTITNLSSGFFIWIKRIVSNHLRQILFLTALGIFALCAPAIWAVEVGNDRNVQSSANTTKSSNTSTKGNLFVSVSYFVPVTFLGVIVPFFLSLLCLLFTFSFLVRHVWRVNNNDSGPSRPNLQAHVTALRTIFFLLLMFTFFIMSRVIVFNNGSAKFKHQILLVSWTWQCLSPSVEAAVIFQASSKLRRIVLGRFWSRRKQNAQT